MKQIGGNIQILLYLLGAVVIAVFSFGMAIAMHQNQVESAAQVPLYKADCSGALWYSATTPEAPCYDVQTYIVLTNHWHKGLDHYSAELTLPNGNDVNGSIVDEFSAKLMSGSYTAEIWHGKLTQILVRNQVLRTQDNPTTKGGESGAVDVAILVIAGIVATLFVILFSAVFVKGLQDGQ